MKAFLASFWRRRWLRGVTWTLVTFMTLWVLFHQWVNWTGARRWRAAQERFTREGESLDLRQLTPEPVPDAQNFCAIPLLKDISLAQGVPDAQKAEGVEANLRLLRTLDVTRASAGGMVMKLNPLASFAMGTPADLKGTAALLRENGALQLPPDSGDPARDLLAGLAVHDARVSELAEGLDRTEAQWTPSWRNREMPATIYEIPMWHYGTVGGLSQYLAFRGTVAARADAPSQAHESLLIMLRLSRACLEDPLLLASLQGATHHHVACNVIWELCRTHGGTAEDFRRLELELRRANFRAALLRGFRFEAAGAADALQWLKRSENSHLISLIDGLSYVDSKGATRKANFGALGRLLPSGWYDMNSASVLEAYHEYSIAPLRDQGFAGCLKRQPDLENWMKSVGTHPILNLDSLFARLTMVATSKLCLRQAYAQDIVNQAIIACVLERYYTTHQAYPESLTALDLEGRPLPLDTFSGKPPGYRRTPDGRYALWTVGPDGSDDGGKRMLDEARPESTKFYVPDYIGDWVWDFPVQQ